MEQLNDGALSLRYGFDFAEGFVSTSRSNLAFEHHAETEMAVLQRSSGANNFRRQRDGPRSQLGNDYE